MDTFIHSLTEVACGDISTCICFLFRTFLLFTEFMADSHLCFGWMISQACIKEFIWQWALPLWVYRIETAWVEKLSAGIVCLLWIPTSICLSLSFLGLLWLLLICILKIEYTWISQIWRFSVDLMSTTAGLHYRASRLNMFKALFSWNSDQPLYRAQLSKALTVLYLTMGGLGLDQAHPLR